MRKYVERLFKAWQNGTKHATSGCGANGASMTLDGDIFYSYSTPLAYWKNGKMWLNSDKYSVTTTRQLSSLIDCLRKAHLSSELVSESELRELIG